MPLQEFWYDDPDLLWVYRNLYIQKMEQDIKLQQEMINYQAWLQGLYIQRAIASNFSKGINYLDKPIDFNIKPKTKQDIAQRIKERAKQGQMILQQRRENKG